MTSNVREYGLATHKHQIQVEEMFLAMLDQGVLTSEELQNVIAGLVADNLKNGSLTPILDAYATLFWPLFPSVPEAAVQDMNLASRLYVEHFTLLDHIIDADIESNFHPPLYLKSTFLLQQSLAILYRYFPQSSSFWDEFQHHQREFLQAFLLEKKLQDGKQEQPYDYTTFKRIATGKVGMIKCTVAALAMLADRPEKLKTLYDLFDEWAIFIQLHDDYVDWKKDLENKHYSYLLQHFFAEIGVQSEQQIHLLDEKVLTHRLFTSQTLQTVMEEMLSYLEHLLQAPEFAECKDWLRYLSTSHHEIKHRKSHLYSIALRRRQIRSLRQASSCAWVDLTV